MTAVPFAVCALYGNEFEQDDDLPFQAGQEITVTEICDEDWYFGHYSKGGKQLEGMFPSNLVEIKRQTEAKNPLKTQQLEPGLQPVPKPAARSPIEDDWGSDDEPSEETAEVKTAAVSAPAPLAETGPDVAPKVAAEQPEPKAADKKAAEPAAPRAATKEPKEPEAKVGNKEQKTPSRTDTADSISSNFKSRRGMFDQKEEEEDKTKPVTRTRTNPTRLNFAFPESPEPKRRTTMEADDDQPAPPRVSIKERLALIQKQEQEMQQREEQERKRRETEDEQLRVEEELRNRELEQQELDELDEQARHEAEPDEQPEQELEQSKGAAAAPSGPPKIPKVPVAQPMPAQTPREANDEEEARKMALRERMARISGAGNIGGISLGMMLGRNPDSGAASAPRKVKKKDISAMSDLERELYLASVEYDEAHGEEIQEEAEVEEDKETLVGARETDAETLMEDETEHPEGARAAPTAPLPGSSVPTAPTASATPTDPTATAVPSAATAPPTAPTVPAVHSLESAQTTDLGLATGEQSSDDEFSDASEVPHHTITSPHAEPELHVRNPSDAETGYEADIDETDQGASKTTTSSLRSPEALASEEPRTPMPEATPHVPTLDPRAREAHETRAPPPVPPVPSKAPAPKAAAMAPPVPPPAPSAAPAPPAAPGAAPAPPAAPGAAPTATRPPPVPPATTKTAPVPPTITEPPTLTGVPGSPPVPRHGAPAAYTAPERTTSNQAPAVPTSKPAPTSPPAIPRAAPVAPAAPAPTGRPASTAPPVPPVPTRAPAPSTPSKAPPVPHVTSPPVHSPPVPSPPAPAPVTAPPMARTGSRTSTELSRRRSLRTGDEVDLALETRWYTQERGLPPSIDARKVLVEFENATVNKRGRAVTNHDVYVVNSDLSQVHINTSYDQGHPDRVQASQQFIPTPKVDSTELISYSQAIGAKLYAAAAAAGTLQPTSAFVKSLVEQVPEALTPIRGTFGLPVYENFGGASVHQTDAIRPGDVAVLVEANFQGTKGPLQKYHKTVSNSVYIVQEFDGTKKKLRVFDAKKESFRMADLQSGMVKVYRVVARDLVGW